jgi:hypothetical protein
MWSRRLSVVEEERERERAALLLGVVGDDAVGDAAAALAGRRRLRPALLPINN